MIEIDPNTPGLNLAVDRLNELMTAEAQAPASVQTEAAQHAAPAGNDVAPVPTTTTTEQTDTPAATEATKPPGTDAPKPEAAAKEPTRYEKAAARLGKSWTELNAEKETFRVQREKEAAEIAAKRSEIERRELELAAETREPGAQDYEAWAGRKTAEAQRLRAQAESLEDAGKFDEAKRVKEQADEARVSARQALRAAEEARTNPPDTKAAARAAKLEAARKEWGVKAGIDFPELMRPGSELVRKVQALLAEEPRLQREPNGVYWAARLASAETAAASVPALRSDLDKARKRAAELERLTAPGGDTAAGGAAQGPRDFGQLSDAEQLAALTQQARAVGSL